jgi:peptidylprolyl isomerase
MLLALTTLAACGDDAQPEDDAKSLSSVSFEGEAGEAPEVTFDGRLSGAKTESEVLIEGEGEEVAAGDTVKVHIWLGNGYSEQETFSTWESQPEQLTVDDTLSEPLREAIEGRTVGSRVAVLSSATESFGDYGNPELGIGNKDSVLWVVDVTSKVNVLDGPQGKKKAPAPWAPKLKMADGVPTGFDFAGTKPGGKLRSTALVEGDGAVVKKGQTITVDYLGQVWKAKEPFDQSFNADPTSFPIGTGAVVKGWDETLVGATVGSRIIIEIPPAKGYGKEGNEGAGIKGTDTIYFVVDVLAAN